MKFKIVSDSSSNVLTFEGVPYESVPLKIVAGEREYVDNAALDVDLMVNELKKTKGRIGSSCPNVYEWKTAMSGASFVFAFAITGSLSGSFAAAVQAKAELEAENPDVQIFVMDTKSTGPEMRLLIEKTAELIAAGEEFSSIVKKLEEEHKRTHLLFCLQSLDNLARNGRVSGVAAKITGLLGIRIVGVASPQGTLELLHKKLGAGKANECIFEEMQGRGYVGGKVHIVHCQNEAGARQLAALVEKKYPNASITVEKTGALCSLYAEVGGLIIGFESN